MPDFEGNPGNGWDTGARDGLSVVSEFQAASAESGSGKRRRDVGGDGHEGVGEHGKSCLTGTGDCNVQCG
jgi:hypothetical protein